MPHDPKNEPDFLDYGIGAARRFAEKRFGARSKEQKFEDQRPGSPFRFLKRVTDPIAKAATYTGDVLGIRSGKMSLRAIGGVLQRSAVMARPVTDPVNRVGAIIDRAIAPIVTPSLGVLGKALTLGQEKIGGGEVGAEESLLALRALFPGTLKEELYGFAWGRRDLAAAFTPMSRSVLRHIGIPTGQSIEFERQTGVPLSNDLNIAYRQLKEHFATRPTKEQILGLGITDPMILFGGAGPAVKSAGLAQAVGRTTARMFRGAGVPPRTAVRLGQTTRDITGFGLFPEERLLGAIGGAIGGSTSAAARAIPGLRRSKPLPGEDISNILGFETLVPRLTRLESVSNVVRTVYSKVTRKPVTLHDPIVSDLIRKKEEAVTNITRQAVVLSEKHSAGLNQAFAFDTKGRIEFLKGVDPSISGAPTIQDVAARLPTYASRLTDDQLNALRSLEQDLIPYRTAMEAEGMTIGYRPDIIPGGFYVPRGHTTIEGVELAPVIRGRAQHAQGSLSSEEAMKFPSQSAGIDDAWKYDSIGEVLHSYAMGTGTKAVNAHAATLLKNVLDPETGLSIAKAAVTAPPPDLKYIANIAKTRLETAQGAISAIHRAKRAEQLPSGTIKAIERVFPEIEGELFPASRITLKDLIRAGIEAAEPPTTLPLPTPGTIKKLRKLLDVAIQRAEASPGNSTLQAAARKLARQLGFAKFRFAKGKAIIEGAEGVTRPFTEAGEFMLERNAVRVLRDIQDKALDELLVRIRGTPVKAKTSGGKPVVKYKGGLIEKIEQQARMAEYERSSAVKAAVSPRGYGRIDMPGLDAVVFPQEMANAANRILRTKGPIIGSDVNPLLLIKAVNTLYRSLRATLDISAAGIQGLIGMFSAPKQYAEAFKIMFHSIVDTHASGSFFGNFDTLASSRGRMTVKELVSEAGLQIGGSATEYRIGQGPLQFISELPVIKEANRAFGAFGDVLRVLWADDLLRVELKRGRLLADIKASGDLKRIGRITNNMTGYSKGRAFSSYGDLLFFAPRFFQARLETLAQATMGLRPGAALNQRVARNSMMKMVGLGTFLTVALNEALGNETDFQPIVNGRWNSNFMRVRALGRDWSIFGTWDSLARGIILTAQGKPQEFMRGMSAGTISIAWDTFSGTSAVGEVVPDLKTQPEEWSVWLMQQFTPFAAEEGFDAIGDAFVGLSDDDLEATLAGGGGFAGEMFGIKSSGMSLTDFRDIVTVDLGFEDKDGVQINRYTNLSRGQRSIVDADSRVKESEPMMRREERAEERVSQKLSPKEITNRFDILRANKSTEEAGLRGRIDAGLSGEDLRKAITEFKKQRWDAYNLLFPDLPEKKLDGPIQDMLAELYWSAELPVGPGGKLDFDALDDARRRVLDQAKAYGVEEDYITGSGIGKFRGIRFEDEVVRRNVEMLERAQADLKPYYAIKRNHPLLSASPEHAKAYERWLSTSIEDLRRNNPEDMLLTKEVRAIMKEINEEIKQDQVEMLEKNPQLDVWLVSYYGRAAVTYAGRDVEDFINERKASQPVGVR